MRYRVELKPRAIKDLRRPPKHEATRVADALEHLEDDLAGDAKPIGRGTRMLTLHPNILERDGKKEYAVLPYDEFERIAQELADYEDLKDLRSARSTERRVVRRGLAAPPAAAGENSEFAGNADKLPLYCR